MPKLSKRFGLLVFRRVDMDRCGEFAYFGVSEPARWVNGPRICAGVGGIRLSLDMVLYAEKHIGRAMGPSLV